MGEVSVVAVGTACPICAWQQNSGAFIWVPEASRGETRSVCVGWADTIWGLGQTCPLLCGSRGSDRVRWGMKYL